MFKGLLRRNSVFFAAILAGAFVGEYAVDHGVDSFFAWYNKGVLAWYFILRNYGQTWT